MKTSELTGVALDWAVGTAMQLPAPYWYEGKCARFSTDWAVGGPLIQREKISIVNAAGDDVWSAYPVSPNHEVALDRRRSGPTPLIAAMRCYVASKLGEGVPDDL